jgi:hypothetical protein
VEVRTRKEKNARQGRRVPVIFHHPGSIIGGETPMWLAAGRKEGEKIKAEPLTKYHHTALFGSVEIVKGGV